MALFETLDSLFGPALANPTFFVLGLSLTLTFIVTVLNILLIKKETRMRIKNDMRRLQQDMKKAQKEKNMKLMQDLQKEQMEIQMLNFKESLKISAVSLILFWFILSWMQHVYVPTTQVVNGTGTINYMHNSYNFTILDANGSKILTADGKSYDLPLKGWISKSYENDDVTIYGNKWKVDMTQGNKITFTHVMVNLPFFGNVGFVGWYILTAFTFGLLFRKLFDLA